MAVRHGYGKIAGTDALVFAYDTGDARNSYKGEPTTNVATGTLTPYTLYNTLTRNGQDLTFTMVAGSALYLTVHNGVDYNGQTITLSGYMFKNGVPHSLPSNRANTYHTVAASKWYFDSTTGYFEIVEVCNTSSIWLFHTPSGANGGDVITIKNFQVEIKSHATPFVNGTRSSTQGLLDLTGNSTIDLTNVSFDTNAQMIFDGTDDYVEIPNTNLPVPGLNYTLECVFQRNSGRTIINYGPAFNGASKYYSLEVPSSVLVANITTSIGSTQLVSSTTISSNIWYHGILTYNGSTVSLYINGVLAASASTSGSILNTSTPSLNIGRKNSGNGEYINGKVGLVKIYNRALTADEVRNNYSNYKTRFNL